ncbi:SGNH/GDSL hydrolase family protein [Flagellimonas crocea]|uniref:SGNH/GDSL hydrolase family protein n=1 Tax=Flagellimonas crocea TaxID=3067311 RepID=UPI00296F181C|nr:GDSL-type esterase/lipase family protein [Muricauda sp. DH64]
MIALRSICALTLRVILILLTTHLVGCSGDKKTEVSLYKANDSIFCYQGRILKEDGHIALISPASGVEFNAMGDSLELFLKSETPPYNYISLSMDGRYGGRYQINGDSIHRIAIALPVGRSESHEIGLYKATEASNGSILFYGAKTKKITPPKVKGTIKIEFIGDSITCGMGADLSTVPCGEGHWFDQHNAYLAFGPRVARALNADYLLSSVSGIGMYRNWNDENLVEPIMPEVYDNLFLNSDSAYQYTFDHVPDIICICLGTNDMSEGDGSKSRLPFNKEKFVGNYIAFTEHLFDIHPNTQLVLLNSPMVSGDKGNLLLESLQKIKDHYQDTRNVSIFQFGEMQPNGCTSHPNVTDHKVMADQLQPFLKQIL